MDNGRDRSPGWLAMSAAKYCAVRHLIHLFESLPNETLSAGTRTKLKDTFRSPMEVDRAFPVDIEAACHLAQDEDEMAGVDSMEGEKPDNLGKFGADMMRLGRRTWLACQMSHA